MPALQGQKVEAVAEKAGTMASQWRVANETEDLPIYQNQAGLRLKRRTFSTFSSATVFNGLTMLYRVIRIIFRQFSPAGDNYWTLGRDRKRQPC